MAELSEEQFIHEGYAKNPWPFWGWFLAVLAVSMLLWGGFSAYVDTLQEQYAHSPFLQVTNRQMSLFLWQNPSYMRVFAKDKNGYLPGFEYLKKVGLNPEYAEEYVIAPPELFFLYHAWERQISRETPLRAIPARELYTFLYEVEEWQPRNWKEAPVEYQALVAKLPTLNNEDLNLLSDRTLPYVVRQAFIGWKNYFLEGEAIAAYHPTQAQVVQFLKSYPHYARNYWCNIAGKEYLKSIGSPLTNPDSQLSDKELAPFLRVALYNAFLSAEDVAGHKI